MQKFGEKDLNEVLKKFENAEKVEIEFENNLSGSIFIKNAKIKYDEKYGFINIDGIDVKLKINTTLVYKYIDEGEKIKIILDTLTINIKKNKY